MTDEEAALLAELKAISNRSTNYRFQEDIESDKYSDSTTTQIEKVVDEHDQESKKRLSTFETPLKRKGNIKKLRQQSPAKASNSEIDSFGCNQEKKGKKIVLQPVKEVINEKKKEEENYDKFFGSHEKSLLQVENGNEINSPCNNGTMWDRSHIHTNFIKNKSTTNTSDIVTEQNIDTCTASSFKEEQTFTGQSGDVAEDVELLAGLGAISSSQNRFAEDEDFSNRLTSNIGENINKNQMHISSNFQRKQTFTGERGGTAEDADLLAELRAISSASSSNRFAEDEEVPDAKGNSVTEQTPSRVDSIPPWKRKKKPAQKFGSSDSQIESSATKAKDRHNNSLQKPPERLECETSINPRENGMDVEASKSSKNIFTGERGGTAEDADLLAELRAISSNSSKNRFMEDNNAGSEEQQEDKSSERCKGTVAVRLNYNSETRNGITAAATTITPIIKFAPPEEQQKISITLDTLTDSLDSKDWKARKAAYEFLLSLLSEKSNSFAGQQIESDLVISGLDSVICSIVKDSNAFALEAALEFSVSYAKCCTGASSAEQARKITSSLLKGNGLASNRQSTIKLIQTLLLRLMEFGSVGKESLHAIIDILLNQGLSSKKTKVVLSSSNLILATATSYGATFLPVSLTTAKIPFMATHTNPSIRECGMNLLAEMCRCTGSKECMKGVIEKLKGSQVSQLDRMLSENPQPFKPSMFFRSSNSATNPVSAIDIALELEKNAKEEELRKFESRPAINLIESLERTDYSSKIKKEKWSEKVAALNLILGCGGEKPYKLKNNLNYTELVREVKTYLSHTHFAVNIKALEVIGMLAEGVGLKIYTHLRPLLITLTSMSKDKKLTSAVSSCLDCLFGAVLGFDHIMEKCDGIPTAVDDKIQKNVLSRTTTLEWLYRCIERNESAGPRGVLNIEAAFEIAKLAALKLNDGDAGPRKVALKILKLLNTQQSVEIKERIGTVIEKLKQSNPRVYKQLVGSKGNATSTTGKCSRPPLQPKHSNQDPPKNKQPLETTKKDTAPRPTKSKEKKPVEVSETTRMKSIVGEENKPTIDEALEKIEKLSIPNWNLAEENDGILAGLQSNSWQRKKCAIDNMCKFVQLLSCSSEELSFAVSPLIVILKAYTKSFKESNMQLSKAIFFLFTCTVNKYQKLEQEMEIWIVKEFVDVAMDKIADKKIGQAASALLSSLSVVQLPGLVIKFAIFSLEKIKSPASHETLLNICRNIAIEFGARHYTSELKVMCTWVAKELESTISNVRKAALKLVSEIHTQLGPMFKALMNNSFTSSLHSSTKVQVDGAFSSSNYDKNAAYATRSKVCVVKLEAESEEALTSRISKTDLVSILPTNCLKKLGTKEDKQSWKLRKEAMDDIKLSLCKCGGLINANTPSLIELLKLLKERLSDSQSNLKVIAVDLIGDLIWYADEQNKGKLGKVVFRAMISAVINESKKQMRIATITAITKATKKNLLEGNCLSPNALEVLFVSLVHELKDSDMKGGGLSEILEFVSDKGLYFPTSSKSSSLDQQLSDQLVALLTSSKIETRSASEAVLKSFTELDVISRLSIQKSVKALIPAHQRAVKQFIDKLEKMQQAGTEGSRMLDTPGKHRVGAEANLTTPSSCRSSSGKNSLNSDRASSTAIKAAVLNTPRAEIQSSTYDGNPLRSLNSSASSKDGRLKKKENWIEFPEDPSDSLPLLKKLWSPLLPSSSVAKLFPLDNFRNQEDAISGVNLISFSISISKKNEDDTLIFDHMDMVCKWLVCALFSREHTTGLNAIVELIKNLFLLMKDRSYQLTDREAETLLPFLIEKGSLAKGRFRDSFRELLDFLTTNDLYPLKNFGQFICISVLESSSSKKAQLLALIKCRTCVEVVGITAVGKKGVNVIAKNLNESLSENRTAALEVIMIVLEKISGDLKKLYKVCGKTLTGKNKELIEEKWVKRQAGCDSSSQGSIPNYSINKRAASPINAPVRLITPSRSSTPVNSVKRKLPLSCSSQRDSLKKIPLKQDYKRKITDSSKKNNCDLPKLDMKVETPRENKTIISTSSPGPFRFTFTEIQKEKEESIKTKEKILHDTPIKTPLKHDEVASNAATLRAKLQQIREKHKARNNLEEISKIAAQTPMTCWVDIQTILKVMINCDDPNDSTFIRGKVWLEKLHEKVTSNISDKKHFLDDLRQNSDECVTLLTSLNSLCIKYMESDYNSGNIVSILSVSLAILMFILRDGSCRETISKDTVKSFIRESTSMLLILTGRDNDQFSKVDKQTNSQLTKAVNKITIQATIVTKRLISLQTLVELQMDLCKDNYKPATESRESNYRFSKVYFKLFSRLLKDEENDEYKSFDTDCTRALIKILKQNEEWFEKYESDLQNSCKSMIESLIAIILKKYDKSTIDLYFHELDIESIYLRKLFDLGEKAELDRKDDSVTDFSNYEMTSNAIKLRARLESFRDVSKN